MLYSSVYWLSQDAFEGRIMCMLSYIIHTEIVYGLAGLRQEFQKVTRNWFY